MSTSSPHEVTRLLLDWRNGDEAALNKLMPLVYGELRLLANSYLRRERADHTLQTTALVHEAYIRLVGQQEVRWESRAQFFGLAAQLMRNILVDHARERLASKRGGGQQRISLENAAPLFHERPSDLVALDDALRGLAGIDERKSRAVELRYFGGLTLEETAEVLGVSLITVRRDLKMAETWLYREMKKQ